MKNLALRVGIGAALAASAIGVGAGAASAAVTHESGCVEWNSTKGCVVKQSCSVDSDDRSWSCMTYDTRTHTLTSQTGAY